MSRGLPAWSVRALPLSALGLLAVFFWLMVGDLGIAIRDRAALPTGLEFLRRHGASDTTTSLLLSTIPALLSVVLVPFVGYHSDRHRGRWGRRRPFLLAAAPVGAAAMIGLAFSPWMGQWTDAALGTLSPGLSVCNLAFFCLFWTLFECASITTGALFAGQVNDVVPTAFLGRFYAVIRVVSLSVGIGFNTWIFALTDHYLFEILIAIGLLFSIPVVLMCLMLREPPRLDPPLGGRSRSLLVPRAHVLECFQQRAMLWTFAAFMCAGVTFSPFNTFCQYYAQVSGISKAALGTMTATGYAVSIASAIGIGWLVDRFGAVRISTLLMGTYLVAAGCGYLWVQDAVTFRLFFLAHVILSGAYFTAAASMPMALFPSERFVQFNSTKDLMVACAGILVSSVQGPLLDVSGHDYRLTLLSGAVFAVLCVACLVRVRSR